MTKEEQLASDIENARNEDRYLLQIYIEKLEQASKERPELIHTNFFTNWDYDIDVMMYKDTMTNEIKVSCFRHGSSVLYPMGFSCGCFENGYCE